MTEFGHLSVRRVALDSEPLDYGYRPEEFAGQLREGPFLSESRIERILEERLTFRTRILLRGYCREISWWHEASIAHLCLPTALFRKLWLPPNNVVRIADLEDLATSGSLRSLRGVGHGSELLIKARLAEYSELKQALVKGLV